MKWVEIQKELFYFYYSLCICSSLAANAVWITSLSPNATQNMILIGKLHEGTRELRKWNHMYFNKGSKWHWTGTKLSFEKPVAVLQTNEENCFSECGAAQKQECVPEHRSAMLVQRHVGDVVSLPAAACWLYPHPRDRGTLWRKKSSPWVLHAWVAEMQSGSWRSISKWFSLVPSTKVIICDICFWAFTLHIWNFSSNFQIVNAIKTAMKM